MQRMTYWRKESLSRKILKYLKIQTKNIDNAKLQKLTYTTTKLNSLGLDYVQC